MKGKLVSATYINGECVSRTYYCCSGKPVRKDGENLAVAFVVVFIIAIVSLAALVNVLLGGAC